MFEILGIAGIAISVAAYVPQVVHLWREHCSEGISTRAWAMWLASGLLIGLLAMHRGDPVFVLLQVCSLTSAAVILLLSRRYRGMVCETHAHPVPSRLTAVIGGLGPSTYPPPVFGKTVGETGPAMSANSTEMDDERKDVARNPTRITDDELIDEAGMESFPASDAPSFWARATQARDLKSSTTGQQLHRGGI